MRLSAFQEQILQTAILQAEAVYGRTSPNPAVGAVVVNGSEIVGVGGTQPPGHAHAERVALQEAGARARGGDLYVTFEPCTFHGRTPPCTDAIIEAGIKRVFYLCRDHDPRMGVGAEHILNAHGIETIALDTYHHQLIPLLGPFLLRVRQQRPWVTLKYAMSLDGKIATHTGVSQWISGPQSRQVVHHIRDQVDAIITGSGTVQCDDPCLNTRLEHPQRAPRNPLRVVIDSQGRTSPNAQIYRTPDIAHTMVFCSTHAPTAWITALQSQGVSVQIISDDTPVDLNTVLRVLHQHHVNHVMVEAGAGLAGALHDADLIDEIRAFLAPGIIGNTQAPGPVGGNGSASLIDIDRFHIANVQLTGADVSIRAYHRQRVMHLFDNPRIFTSTAPAIPMGASV